MAYPAFISSASDYTRNGGSFGLASSITVNKPAGVVAGDIMLAAIFIGEGNNYASMATPSGWTLIDNIQVVGGFSNRYKTAFFYRVVTGSEGSSFTFTLGSLWTAGCTIAAYSQATVGQMTASTIPAGGPYTIPSVTTLESTETIVAMHAYDYGDTRTAPAGWTERSFFTGIPDGCYAQVEFLDKHQAAPGATGTADITMSTHQVDLASAIATVSLIGAAVPAAGGKGFGTMVPCCCG